MTPGPILFTPGPCMTPPDVVAAAATSLFHREDRFQSMLGRVQEGLLRHAGGVIDFACVPLGCSGSGALEAVLTFYGGPLLVLRTGLYAERLAATARQLGIKVESLDWLTPSQQDLAILDARLARPGAPKIVALVHHETATGRMTDFAGVAAVAAAHAALVIADAIASFAGHPCTYRRPGVGAVVLTPNKCLESLPGLSFALLPLAAFARPPAMSGGVYLDLAAQHSRLLQTGEPRFTLPVQAIAALEVALQRLDVETIAGRARRYRRLRERLRDGGARAGLVPIDPPENRRSSFIQTFRAPPPGLFAQWRAQLARQGLIIHTDAATLAEGGFYLSVAGDLGAADIDRLIAALSKLVVAAPHA